MSFKLSIDDWRGISEYRQGFIREAVIISQVDTGPRVMHEPSTHRWIENPAGLEDLRRSLQNRRSLALDSESNSGFAYQEKLCLLQINDGSEIWLLDLLALPGGKDGLETLRPIFEEPDYEIQLHGGEFDVGCLKRDYGISLAGVWDSQQATSFLGWAKTGYGAVVEEVCGVSLPKAHTRHDWSCRPVTGPELQYAINDVRYLPEVAADLHKRVRASNLEEEVLIACAAVEQAAWNGGFKPAGFWAIKGVRQLSKESREILMALFVWRETIARELDLPPGRTLNNELLVALARNAPYRPEQLKRLGVPRRVTNRWTSELLGVIAEARRSPPELPPQPAKLPFDAQVRRRGERLKKWRRQEAERREVPMQVVLPVAALRHLQQNGGEDLESVPQLGAKRIHRYGDILAELVSTRP